MLAVGFSQESSSGEDVVVVEQHAGGRVADDPPDHIAATGGNERAGQSGEVLGEGGVGVGVLQGAEQLGGKGLGGFVVVPDVGAVDGNQQQIYQRGRFGAAGDGQGCGDQRFGAVEVPADGQYPRPARLEERGLSGAVDVSQRVRGALADVDGRSCGP